MNKAEKRHLKKLGMSNAGVWEIENHMRIELNKLKQLPKR